ncbi:DUF6194 family protein [Nocardioides sp. LHD-245]|uniref:DUF6194 family protein n=1 Tax=Nocardioides sp. LHD-245 TaxID=3051387 RepID=UPI0027E1750D|nr:DUF6194 family protein [Nocardioides sp. LHD-245]
MTTATSMEQILDVLRSLPDVLELAPTTGSEFPEIAWGDHFFYVAPDGEVPRTEQPFATIVTKDYPDDATSRLDPPGRWRLNIHVGKARFADLLGDGPGAWTGADDPAAADTLLPHPVYRAQGWVAIIAPGPATLVPALVLLREAHAAARRRRARRTPTPPAP